MPFEIEKRWQTPGGVKKHGKLHKPGTQPRARQHPHDQDQSSVRHHENKEEEEKDDDEEDFVDAFADSNDEVEGSIEKEKASDEQEERAHEGQDDADTQKAKRKKISERRKRRQAFLARNRSPAWRSAIRVRKGKTGGGKSAAADAPFREETS
jgi:hypothetical protein